MTLYTGDLAFYHDKDMLSKLIQWKTKSDWNHVGMIFLGWGHEWLIQSTISKGAHILLLSDRVPHMVLHTNVPVSQQAMDWAFEQFKQPYSMVDAFRAGMGRRTNNAGLICSEYAGNILNKSGEAISEWGMTPQALWKKYA